MDTLRESGNHHLDNGTTATKRGANTEWDHGPSTLSAREGADGKFQNGKAPSSLMSSPQLPSYRKRL